MDAANQHAGPTDTLRVQVDALHPPTLAPQGGTARKGGTHDQHAGATQRSGHGVGIRGATDGQSGTDSHSEQFQLELPVSLGAVGGDQLSTETGGNALPSRVDDPRAVCEALEARLRRYSTSLEQDLAGLPIRNSGKSCVEDATEEVSRVGEGAGGTADLGKRDLKEGAVSDWVELCVRVRAAEKCALGRALQEAGSRTAE